jgi:uncharacterized protein
MEQLILRHRQLLANLQTSFTRTFTTKIDWNDRLIGIRGSRGVGKTTLCLQHILLNFGISANCLYVTLDDVLFPYNNLLDLAKDFSGRGGTHLFIDEIHKYPRWIAELKNIYDFYPDLHIVFTGSSVLHLDNSTTDLSRRALMYTMPGLSFREFLEIETKKSLPVFSLAEILANHEHIAFQLISTLKPLKYFEQYLHYGYYPFYLQNHETYSIKLSQLINLVIEADLPYLARIEYAQINKLKRFLYLLGTYVPFKPNISKLGETMQVTRQTITNYLHLLEKAGILTLIYSNQHKLSALAKPEKLFLHHPNYYYALSGENSNSGNIRETFFVNQLSTLHQVEVSDIGDFTVDGTYIFEIGGARKNYNQIAGAENSYIVSADLELGIGNKIPLWLFGFMY